MLVMLFGAQAFPNAPLTAHAAFERAAQDFAAYARDELGAEVHSFFGSAAPWQEQLDGLREVTSRGGHDTLLIYYVGHGLFTRAGGRESYGLAVAATRAGIEYRTSLPTDVLAEEIRACPCKQRIVILDACFAAAAVSHFQSSSYARRLRPTFESVAGVAVLAAASKDDVARVADDGGYTMFTGALLEVLREGDNSCASPKLSLSQVAMLVQERLGAKGGARPELHVPNQRGGRVDEAPLFPNRNPATGNEAPREQRPLAANRSRPPRSWRRQLASSATMAVVAGVVGLLSQEWGASLRTSRGDGAPPPLPETTDTGPVPPPPVVLSPPTSEGAGARAGSRDVSNLRTCCAALRSGAATMPPPNNTNSLKAADYCDVAAASGQERDAALRGIRSALRSAPVPGSCR
jgi:Caspase domain